MNPDPNTELDSDRLAWVEEWEEGEEGGEGEGWSEEKREELGAVGRICWRSKTRFLKLLVCKF